MEKSKKKLKVWQKALIIIGIILAVLMIAAAVAFFWLRARFSGPSVTIGDATDLAIVQTNSGAVRGYISDGIYTYHGIPYGEAAERFVAAAPAKAWDGIRDATEYGPISPQGTILGGSGGNAGEGTDNNCLNLNLWTPGLDGQKRPVLVWFHGGGFSSGSANDAQYDGEALAKYGDVVIVGVNHRLNLFGHLDLSAYGEKYRYSGNAGVTDMVAAMQWIHDNIEAFGGDPENVTAFGQSGGGAKVLALMSSPFAGGLIQKGIVESGATETLGVTFTTKEASLYLTELVLDTLGIDRSDIDAIQSVEPDALFRAGDSALQATANAFRIPAPLTDGYQMEWGPVIDGDYLPTAPVTESGFADAGFDIPLLIGSNLNEWTMFMRRLAYSHMTEEQIRAYLDAYPENSRSDAPSVDTLIRLPMLKLMSHKADQGGAPVYAYVFTYGGTLGAYHGAEIPYVFRHAGEGNRDQEVQELMSGIWVNFAKTGVPSAEGIPVWEPYDRETGATMILNTQSRLAHNHDKALMSLLEPDYVY